MTGRAGPGSKFTLLEVAHRWYSVAGRGSECVNGLDALIKSAIAGEFSFAVPRVPEPGDGWLKETRLEAPRPGRRRAEHEPREASTGEMRPEAPDSDRRRAGYDPRTQTWTTLWNSDDEPLHPILIERHRAGKAPEILGRQAYVTVEGLIRWWDEGRGKYFAETHGLPSLFDVWSWMRVWSSDPPPVRTVDVSEVANEVPAADRGPLPQTEILLLCEVLSWLALGRAMLASDLKSMHTENIGDHATTIEKAKLDAAAQLLIEALRRGELAAWGRRRLTDPLEKLPAEYLKDEIWAYPVEDQIGVDYRAWEKGPLPEIATYHGVRFDRADIARLWPPPVTQDIDVPVPERRRGPKRDVTLERNLTDIVERAARLWPDPAERPPLEEMARVLRDRGEGYDWGTDALRKILAGTYRPMRARGIPGLGP